jgi:hypothetical protein
MDDRSVSYVQEPQFGGGVMNPLHADDAYTHWVAGQRNSSGVLGDVSVVGATGDASISCVLGDGTGIGTAPVWPACDDSNPGDTPQATDFFGAIMSKYWASGGYSHVDIAWKGWIDNIALVISDENATNYIFQSFTDADGDVWFCPGSAANSTFKKGDRFVMFNIGPNAHDITWWDQLSE